MKNDINVHLQDSLPCKRKVGIMSATINFMQALRELTGFDEVIEEDDELTLESRGKGLAASGLKPESSGRAKPAGSAIKREFPQQNPVTPSQEGRKDDPTGNYRGSYITSSMVINGNIKTSGDVTIEGSVYGDVDAGGNVAIKNLIVGDVKAANVSFIGARVKGNVATGEKVALDEASILVGDVNAGEITVSGKIKGDLKVSNLVVLKEQAVVAGNIFTGSFVSNPGASIRGSVITASNTNFDDDAEFCLGVEEHEGR